MLVIQADDDHNVPFSQSVQTVNGLRHQGVPYDLIVIPDEIHDLLLFRSWLTYFHAQSGLFRPTPERRVGHITLPRRALMRAPR